MNPKIFFTWPKWPVYNLVMRKKLFLLFLFPTLALALSDSEMSKLRQLIPEYSPKESVPEVAKPAAQPKEQSEAVATPQAQTSASVKKGEAAGNEEKEFIAFKEKARQNLLAVEQHPNMTPEEKKAMVQVLKKIQNYTLEDFHKIKGLIHKQQLKMNDSEAPDRSEDKEASEN